MNNHKTRDIPLFMLLCSCLLLMSCNPAEKADTGPNAPEFVSSSSVEAVRAQIAKLPTDDVWWNVYGEDQAWNFKNLHRFMPTVNVYRDGQVRTLAQRPMSDIPNQIVDTPSGSMGFKDFLDSDKSTTMSIVILHEGDVVFEYYPNQQPYEKPIYWSATKALVAALVGILADRGQVDLTQPISHYLPRLKDSDYANITVRNLLDMATGVNCPEEYFDRTSCYYKYSVTIGDGYWTKDSPDSPYDMLATLKPGIAAPQGTQYQYSGVNAFILSWLVEDIMNMPFQDAVSKEIWSKMGAESDGSILAPRYGVPIAHGGLLARSRDVARFGLLYTPSYTKISDSQIISDRMINLILNDKNPNLTLKANKAGQLPPDFSHSGYLWDAVYTNDDFYRGGWAGQGLLINPTKDIVAVYTGYAIDPQESQPDLLPILRQVLNNVFSNQ
ncbi:serine hydrolase domain-containing protein [Porticoccaceae bacterium nBUS_17]